MTRASTVRRTEAPRHCRCTDCIVSISIHSSMAAALTFVPHASDMMVAATTDTTRAALNPLSAMTTAMKVNAPIGQCFGTLVLSMKHCDRCKAWSVQTGEFLGSWSTDKGCNTSLTGLAGLIEPSAGGSLLRNFEDVRRMCLHCLQLIVSRWVSNCVSGYPLGIITNEQGSLRPSVRLT